MSENTVPHRSDMPLVRIAAASPAIKVGDPEANVAPILRAVMRARELGVKFLALPELVISGATLGALLSHPTILAASKRALDKLAHSTRQTDMVISVGLPYEIDGVVRSTAAVIKSGKVLALIPSRGDAGRYGFTPELPSAACARRPLTPVFKLHVGFGGALYRQDEAKEGSVMLISSSNNATAKSYDELTRAIADFSARTGMATAFASPGAGESTTSFVFDGLCAIAAGGEIIASSKPLEKEPFVYADVSLETLAAFEPYTHTDSGDYVSADIELANAQLERILELQSAALVRRCEHIKARGFVVGVSGGLDSALALLASAAAADRLGFMRSSVVGISMPGFGTSPRTHSNSEKLVRALGAEYRERSIVEACRQHFRDIGHDENVHDSVYENAQARERTKILLSIANGEGLLDVGTGDLSEAALGFTTFGGDHLAQYGVNASIPKTVIRRVAERACERFTEAAPVIRDILATPVSPELLPAVEGVISQKTEEIVGSYELHDYFIYRFLAGEGPKAIFESACRELDFPREEVYRVLGIFLKRFFSQEFKRNCAPEAPLICVSLAPAVFTMPSDIGAGAFLREYEGIDVN